MGHTPGHKKMDKHFDLACRKQQNDRQNPVCETMSAIFKKIYPFSRSPNIWTELRRHRDRPGQVGLSPIPKFLIKCLIFNQILDFDQILDF